MDLTAQALVAAYPHEMVLVNPETNGTLAVRLQSLVGLAFVPPTIAASAIRAATAPSATSFPRRDWPPYATVVPASSRWVGKLAESLVVRFVRQLLIDHDFLTKEHTRMRRIRQLRRTTEALGRMHNLVAPVFVRGRFGLPGGVRVRRGAKGHYWFEPKTDNDHVLIYLHGGGFVIGSHGTNGEMVARIAAACNLRTLLVEYRRSPEARFPDALVDALNGVRAVLATGVDPGRVLLGGDSAGGTLVIATLLTLKKIGVRPKAAVLLSPFVDLDDKQYDSENDDFDIVPSLDAVAKRRLRDLYFHTSMPRRPRGLVSPASASRKQLASLRGIPILVHVGGREILRDSICAWANKAVKAGADIQLTVFDDEIHAFAAFGFAPAWPEAQRDLAVFVAAQTHPRPKERVIANAAARVSRLLRRPRIRRYLNRTQRYSPPLS